MFEGQGQSVKVHGQGHDCSKSLSTKRACGRLESDRLFGTLGRYFVGPHYADFKQYRKN